jgi:formylglycine-generating enzyme required for sulfatase activity/tetratricopeptide (TPR) repeat protein
MVKGKSWTPVTLRDVGGTEGVGVTFLEETFSSPQGNPKYRLHQNAAQAVLRVLLPETRTNIKGEMRSEQELKTVSGYGGRPRDFTELVHILDNELRLISPTEPEHSSAEGQTPSGRYFQLTHDYLVPSLREWLTRKQRETRRGRAEFRLAERSALWNAKPENRLLPSRLEWANIRLLTEKKDWTPSQRKMMRRAARVHGLRTLGTLVLISLISWATWESYGSLRASALLGSLQKVRTSDVPAIVDQLSPYRHWADPQLVSVIRRTGSQEPEYLHASLALLPVDATQINYLIDRLFKAKSTELPVLRDSLKAHKTTLSPKLWAALESATPGDVTVLPCASALSNYDPENTKWEGVCAKVAQTLVTINSIHLGPWLEALRPVRGRLVAPLVSIFKEKRSESEHTQATNILTDYASDDPDQLAELLMVSDHKAYLSLFPVAEKKAEKILPIFQAELAKKATYSWDDPALNPSWTTADPALVSRIESAEGILAEHFAFCQTMPMDEFLTTTEALRKSGYRPVRFRPYADEQLVRVAAVWTRDGRNWRISSDLGVDDIRSQDERNKKDKFLPLDVVGYVTTGAGRRPTERYAAIWAERTGDDDARIYVGVTTDYQSEFHQKLSDKKLIPRTLHAMIGSDGHAKYCGVWGQPPGAAITGQTHQAQFQGNFEQKQADLGEKLLMDIVVNGGGKPQPIRERILADLANADEKLKTKPDDLDARFSRAMANLRRGENPKALDDLQIVIGKYPENVSVRQHRIIALARLRKKQDAVSDLAKFQKAEVSEGTKLFLAAVVAAELGEGLDKAIAALEAAIKKQPTDADLRYDAARAFSLVSSAVSRSDKTKGRQHAERSLELLREAVKTDDADFGKMDEDGDLDPIRDDPAFTDIMKAGHPDRRYAAVWSDAENFEARPLYGLDPATHMQKCREMIAQGYRLVSSSVSRCDPSGPLVSASVWHRPTIQEDVKDRLAERQATAAISLVRMGKADEMSAMFRHGADPRLRSFILNRLKPFGVDPWLIATKLDQIVPSARPTLAPGQQRMDAILFHPETSQRRALILSLGTYGTESLPAGEREALIGKLLDLYRNDPDSGIHGAAEWTLRKWGQQDKLRALDAQLMKEKDRGERRWFINSQGQTFAVIDGPVDFRMGSPPTETERFPGNEPTRRIMIPRSFAIAAKEVTVEQFQRFVRTFPRFEPPASFLKRFTPDPGGPMLVGPWYAAAAYCNWLSDQEGLPKERWCYIPNSANDYAEGMSIPADVLERSGYRLPTEAEWEYACRAGAVTSRYYGHSLALLDAYGWYQSNSNEHAWTGGSKFSNDLGLFDMLGNMSEWCQDSWYARKTLRNGISCNIVLTYETITARNSRVMRGGSFFFRPSYLRSALRNYNFPNDSNVFGGFRPSRTYP